MEISTIIEIVTVIVTLILGVVAKKSKFIDSNKIPIQNLIIGIFSFAIDYIITKDFNTALIFSGLLAGGTYDLLKNLKQLSNINDDNNVEKYQISTNEVPKALNENELENELESEE